MKTLFSSVAIVSNKYLSFFMKTLARCGNPVPSLNLRGYLMG